MAIGCYLVHAGYTLAHEPAQNLLWGCHFAALLVGFGWLARAPRLNAVGTLWLSYGFPMWIIGLASGVELVPTSPITHVGGLLMGLWGLKQMRLPAGSWWKASLATAGLMLLTRAVAPPEDNVNLAFGVQAGWEDTFTSYPVYVVVILGGGAALFLVVELVLRRVFRSPCDPPQTSEDPA